MMTQRAAECRAAAPRSPGHLLPLPDNRATRHGAASIAGPAPGDGFFLALLHKRGAGPDDVQCPPAGGAGGDDVVIGRGSVQHDPSAAPDRSPVAVEDQGGRWTGDAGRVRGGSVPGE